MTKRDHSDRESRFVTTNTITRSIKEAFGVIIRERPYVLRSYFDTQLLMAESKVRLPHVYRQFFMGHKGDIEAKYTTNKRRLPDDLILDMRDAYRRSQMFLVPEVEGSESEEDRRERVLRELRAQAEMYGLDPRSIRMDGQEPARMTSETAMRSASDMAARSGGADDLYEYAIVEGFDNLQSYMKDGWTVIVHLDGGKVVVRRDHNVGAPLCKSG